MAKTGPVMGAAAAASPSGPSTAPAAVRRDQPRRARLERLLRRWGRNHRGAVAIEFAIVAIPFFAIVFAVMETAMVFLANNVLETAVANASRLIRTGQVQAEATSKADFRALVCENLSGMFECDGKLHVDVRTYATFADISYEIPLDEDDEEFDEADAAYTPGSAGDIVVIRVFYQWPVIFDMFGFNLANLANGRRLLGSVIAFRNEPFPWASPF